MSELLVENIRKYTDIIVRLSAHLWESTGNTTYLNSANLSATFMYTHMYSQSEQVMIDSCVHPYAVVAIAQRYKNRPSL